MNEKLSRIAAAWAAPVAVGIVAAIIGSYFLPESIAEQARRQDDIVPPG